MGDYDDNPLNDPTFSITDDVNGPVLRLGGEVVGNVSPSSRREYLHRQQVAQQMAGTPEDMEVFTQLQAQDPDFNVIREQMVELVESGQVPPEDVRDISFNPKRFIHELVFLPDLITAHAWTVDVAQEHGRPPLQRPGSDRTRTKTAKRYVGQGVGGGVPRRPPPPHVLRAREMFAAGVG